MFCKKCGRQLKEGVQFCMYCGEKVNVSQPDDQIGYEDTPAPEETQKAARNLLPVI